ncbi:hypothetical protein I306_00210 [Cryptococcus gattii EJB2]|uniref:Uncharacterized protein n=1 Tax=Cryptococcus gattii EJB2 TaxID=1296103 RepID=A0ABR5C4I5_9TREE|nr:hypothetical protein I306_00210 [Cryptococcus gattii EJB2]
MSPHGRSLPQAIFRLTTNYMTPVLSAEESSHLHVYHPQMMLEACNSHHAINCIKIPQSEDEKSGDHRISNKGRELVHAEHHDNASTLPTTLSVVVATLSGFCLTIRCLLAQVEAGSFTETVDGDWIADSDEIANHTAAVE